MKLGIFLGSLFNRKWGLAAFLWHRTLYGMTHVRCVRCRRWKGLSAHRHCYECQLKNLEQALADVPDEEV